MIKKILIFVFLLAGGFITLYLLVDPEKAASANGSGETKKKPALNPKDRGKQGPGIPIPTKNGPGSAIVAKPGGEIRIPKSQRVKLPSGSFRLVPIYELHAKNSRTEVGSRLALEDVTVNFFKIDHSDPTDPKPIKTATMTAGTALIELSRDENQVSQIADDKLMEFWNVVYASGSAGDLRNTTFTVGHAHAINTEGMIRLWTPNRREPVRIESLGENGFVITGEGLDAWVPASRDEKGEVQVKTVGVKDVTVLHNPLFVGDDMTLRSVGPLQIKEDSRTQTILVTMRDSVEIISRRSSQKNPKRVRVLRAKGETLRAMLSRFETKDRSKMYWRGIDLHGKPARLTDGHSIDLTCRHMTVLPDTSGRPFWITAEGDEGLAPVMKHVVGGKTNTYTCEGKVHVVEIGRQHGFFLNSYGIPGGIPKEFDQLILFDGQVEIDSPKDGLKMSSSRGITLLRSNLEELRDYVILHGRGEVRVTSAEINASGNQGFVLQQRPVAVGKKSVIVRDFRLGPNRPDTSHHYALRRLAVKAKKPGDRDTLGFHCSGSGSCRVRMRGETAEEVHLSSLAEDVDVRLTGTEGHLWQVQTLDAWFQPDGMPASFVAKGKDCRLEFTTKDGSIHGKAEEIHHPAADTYRLVGNLAEATNKKYGLLRGRDIFIEQLSDKDVRLRATQRAELHMLALPERKKASAKAKPKRDVNFILRADEIRAEPFLVPPQARRLFENFLPRHTRDGTHSRYLFADGNVTFEYVIKEGDKVDTGKGRGDALVLRSDPEGTTFTEGRLTGKPARISSLDARGRKTAAESRLVWFLRERGGQYVTLHKVEDHLPVLRVFGLPLGRSGEPGRLMMACDGMIAMEPRTIRCKGPVTARGLDPRGAIDPEGYMLDSKSMVMRRSEKGEVTSVQATGDVKFRWIDASGTCDELGIDLLQTTLTAKGIKRPAVVVMPSGKVHLTQVNYNYHTKMAEVWKGRVLTRK